MHATFEVLTAVLCVKSPGLLHCVGLSVVADVSNDHIDFIFRVKQSCIYMYIFIYISLHLVTLRMVKKEPKHAGDSIGQYNIRNSRMCNSK
jgi:hypothetical protein